MRLITQAMMYMSARRSGAFESTHMCDVYMCVNGCVGVRERSPWWPSAKQEVFLTSFSTAFALTMMGSTLKTLAFLHGDIFKETFEILQSCILMHLIVRSDLWTSVKGFCGRVDL